MIFIKAAVYTGSRNLYESMTIAAKSLIANSDVDKIYFLIEDDIFPYSLPSIIETRNVSHQTYFKKGTPNMRTKFTYFALMRAALPLYFSDLDSILSLDVDTIALRKCSGAWEIDISDSYFAAAVEPRRSGYGFQYTNAGVTLFNLDKLRESGKAEEAVDVLNRRKFEWVDQDIMNYLCQGYISELSSEYNANDFTKPCTNPRIRHFAGIPYNVWTRNESIRKYANMTWDDIFLERKQLEYRS